MTTIGSFCTGYGGLDMAVHHLIGGDLAWVSDIDPDVNRLLEARFPDVPNIGDIRAAGEVEPVDVVIGGFPCQGQSTAGKRKGVDDERWIWPHILTLVGRMDPRPRLLLWENVPGLLTVNGGDAMAGVVEGMARLGYVGQYRLLRASDVGACHQRRRWFCVAFHTDNVGRQRAITEPSWDDGRGRQGLTPDPDGGRVGSDSKSDRGDVGVDGDGEPEAVSRGPEVAHAADTPPGRYFPTPTSWLGRRPGNSDIADPGSKRVGSNGERSVELTDTVAKLFPTPTTMLAEGGNTSRSGDRKDELLLGGIIRSHDPEVWGPYADALDRHAAAVGSEAPAPVVDGKLNPGFVEWMMMLPPGWVTDLGFTRAAALRMLGNGVVPAQAIAAYGDLLGVAA